MKKLSEEEKKLLHAKASLELNRLEKIYSDRDVKARADAFKDKFQICEAVYKTLLAEHQYRKTGKLPQRMKLDMRQVPHVLTFAGYGIEKDLQEKLFGGEKKKGTRSAKMLRDMLTHSMDERAIQELNERNEELHNDMDNFLKAFKQNQ